MLVRRLLNIGKLWRGGAAPSERSSRKFWLLAQIKNLRHNSTTAILSRSSPPLADAIVSRHGEAGRLSRAF